MKTSFRKETINIFLALSVAGGVSFSNTAFSQPSNNQDIPAGKRITIPAPHTIPDAKRNGLTRIVPAADLPGPGSYVVVNYFRTVS